MTLQVCNEAVLCTSMAIGTILIVNDRSVLYTSHDISIDVIEGQHFRRRKRHPHNKDMEINVEGKYTKIFRLVCLLDGI